MSQPVTVTERAARRIAEIVAGEPTTPLLRVSVEGGGCSGFQYKFDLVGGREADDLVIEREGARVLIDPVSLDYLGGSEIDFVDDLIGAVLQDQQSASHRLLRLRHQLFDLRGCARRAADIVAGGTIVPDAGSGTVEAARMCRRLSARAGRRSASRPTPS